ncbi:MAG: hypothetical protein JSV78_08545 [Phycisphaerales bacterium]|nr:MAG: hypothetical protein JSV78_08545 [Phycisphaerales bacterium]
MRLHDLTVLAICAALVCPISGCIELRAVILKVLGVDDGTEDGTGGGGRPGDDGSEPNENDNEPAPGAVPRVRLTVSNVVPQLGEQVNLSCQRTDGVFGEEVEYSFTPEARLATIDRERGTAILIVEQSDLGAQLSFTCQGANEFGTGPEASWVTIIPQ